MKDMRKRTTWEAMKISLLITAPLTAVLAVYGDVLLATLKPEYREAHPALAILSIAIIPSTIATGINTLTYAYGIYRLVLELGLATNITRTTLYVALTPIAGGRGAATAFLAGTIAGMATAIHIAKKLNFRINWREIATLLAVPSATALSLPSSTLTMAPGHAPRTPNPIHNLHEARGDPAGRDKGTSQKASTEKGIAHKDEETNVHVKRHQSKAIMREGSPSTKTPSKVRKRELSPLVLDSNFSPLCEF